MLPQQLHPQGIAANLSIYSIFPSIPAAIPCGFSCCGIQRCCFAGTGSPTLWKPR